MVSNKICTSCQTEIVSGENSAQFKCPNCKALITRCGKCRKSMIKYACPECKTGGP
ncbi:MAG: zinc finger domain-containing protein [Candidatus Nanoarchaeia archaeon]|nr:zinc finger domain-containing protein [Candidatus Nanoarchaeia archaeon]MDD5054352.1 zinc finger domain-containing protein [Candidatus Nanoarchaeia archaeon]MDD5499696.1 zinc finger domain-containing protein [Candidatus Nanoarchaeia archaeon]